MLVAFSKALPSQGFPVRHAKETHHLSCPVKPDLTAETESVIHCRPSVGFALE